MFNMFMFAFLGSEPDQSLRQWYNLIVEKEIVDFRWLPVGKQRLFLKLSHLIV